MLRPIWPQRENDSIWVNLLGLRFVGVNRHMNYEAERESFDDAFDRLFRIAYRAAYRLLGSREDAEDIAIDALVKASLRWKALRPSADPWVTTVSVNLALDLWRRRKRAPVQDPPEPVTPPDERRLDLVQALERLPDRQRATIALRYFADLSEAQTADALGVSKGTVKKHTSRAIDNLKRELDS